jgi:hypothetical protein
MTPRPTSERSAGVGAYLKRAFFAKWNVLLFLGGAAAAAMSPWPDALLPIVGAMEAAYLGLLIGSPKFRGAVDAEAWRAAKAPARAAQASSPVQEILVTLSPESRRRFEQLRGRCLDMRGIATAVRGQAGPARPGEDLSTPALDKLLWVFLRLLVSREALGRFVERTSSEEIRARLADARAKLEAHAGGEERIVRSLTDNVAAQEQRLENYERARKNGQFVDLELDRIEAKIQALTESSVNRGDPDLLSSQIDSVAESMQSTEKAIHELSHITGLVDEMQDPPAILEADLGRVSGS